MQYCSYHWARDFRRIYHQAEIRYRSGQTTAQQLLTDEEQQMLASIGCSSQEMLDYVEDWVRGEALSFEDALLIASVRRDFFLEVQGGTSSKLRLDEEECPPRDAEYGGVAWLPRIIRKAEAKLRGEMPDHLMYCCGGDRRFLNKFAIHPADFLKLVWSTGGEPAPILSALQKSQSKL